MNAILGVLVGAGLVLYAVRLILRESTEAQVRVLGEATKLARTQGELTVQLAQVQAQRPPSLVYDERPVPLQVPSRRRRAIGRR